MTFAFYIFLGFIAFIILSSAAISWYNNLKKKKEKQKQYQYITQFAINHNLTIDSKQRFNKNIIGIDRLNYAVVFLNHSTRKFLLVQLRELAHCYLVKERCKSSGHIKRIYLKCVYCRKDKEAVILPFYNEKNDDVYMLMRLSKRATYWAKRINLFREAAILKSRYRMSA